MPCRATRYGEIVPHPADGQSRFLIVHYIGRVRMATGSRQKKTARQLSLKGVPVEPEIFKLTEKQKQRVMTIRAWEKESPKSDIMIVGPTAEF